MGNGLERLLFQGKWFKHFEEDYIRDIKTYGNLFQKVSKVHNVRKALEALNEMELIRSLQFLLTAPNLDTRIFDEFHINDAARTSVFWLDRFIAGMQFPLSLQDIASLYAHSSIQTCVRRVLSRIAYEIQSFRINLMDAYQECYVHFVPISLRFLYACNKDDQNKAFEFLMYLERFLYKRIREWHIRTNLQLRYDRKASNDGKQKYRSVRNALINDYNARQNHVEGTSPDKYILEVATLNIEEMVAIIRESSSRQAQCIELHYGRELTVDEIAQETGLRPGTVKWNMSKGREKLKAWSPRREIS